MHFRQRTTSFLAFSIAPTAIFIPTFKRWKVSVKVKPNMWCFRFSMDLTIYIRTIYSFETLNFKIYFSIWMARSKLPILAFPSQILTRMKLHILIVEVHSTWLQKCLPSKILLYVGLAILIKSIFMPLEFCSMSFCSEDLLFMLLRNSKSFKPFYTLSPNSLKPQ